MDSAVVEALKIPVGAAAIPLGFSAIALGGFLKGAFGKSASRGGGSGPRSSNGSAPTGGINATSGPNFALRNSDYNRRMNVFDLRISGEDLLGSININNQNSGDFRIGN